MSVKTENTEKTKKKHVRHRKKGGILTFLRVMIGILLVAVIALSCVLYLAKAGLIFPRSELDADVITPFWVEPTPEPVVYTVTCVTPLDEDLTFSALEGENVTLPDAPEIEGYTFLNWKDGKGKIVDQTEFVLESDLTFSAVYVPAFRDASTETSHAAFLSVDEDGFFHPDEPLSRSEFVVILYAMLDPALTGVDGTADSLPEGRFDEAAAKLKELGVAKGYDFSSDDPISLAELFNILSDFFPQSAAECSFDNIPSTDPCYGAFCLAMEKGWIEDSSVSAEQILTRRDAARIFNRLVGRTGNVEEDYARVGTILDVSFFDPDFRDIAESAIPHETSLETDGEHWVSSEALPLREEGLFFIGTELHCIDAQGSAVVNGSYGNFDFGPNGVITTGMPELDELVQKKLIDLKIDPSTMEKEQMLRIIYSDVTYHNSYLMARKNELHEMGDISWVNDAAYRMLTIKKGCCYNFSAAFYVLAKAIGYDAVIYSGTINPPPLVRAHGWVEIEFDGVPYIFDTELEYTQVIGGNTGTSYYKISYERVKGWYYNRGEQAAAAAEG